MYGQNTKKLFNKGDFVMIFQDNVMKEYLKNVYFITGTPCGGKTTLSCALAEKYGFELFDIDERFEEHKKYQIHLILLMNMVTDRIIRDSFNI